MREGVHVQGRRLVRWERESEVRQGVHVQGRRLVRWERESEVREGVHVQGRISYMASSFLCKVCKMT